MNFHCPRLNRVDGLAKFACMTQEIARDEPHGAACRDQCHTGVNAAPVPALKSQIDMMERVRGFAGAAFMMGHCSDYKGTGAVAGKARVAGVAAGHDDLGQRIGQRAARCDHRDAARVDQRAPIASVKQRADGAIGHPP